LLILKSPVHSPLASNVPLDSSTPLLAVQVVLGAAPVAETVNLTPRSIVAGSVHCGLYCTAVGGVEVSCIATNDCATLGPVIDPVLISVPKYSVFSSILSAFTVLVNEP